MDPVTAVSLLCQVAMAVFLIHYKGQVEKRRSDDAEKYAGLEKRISVGETKSASCDIQQTEMKGKLEGMNVKMENLQSRFGEHRQDINDKLAKLDSKFDKLADKIERALFASKDHE